MNKVNLPDLKIKGTGAVAAPTLTDAMLDEMMARADKVEDQTIKTDLFLLILEVRAQRGANNKAGHV